MAFEQSAANTSKAAEPTAGERYLAIGRVIGAVAGVLTFIGCWIYCIASSGFLLGVGLGWLPAGIVAAIVGFLARYLWGPVAAVAPFAIWAAIPQFHRSSETVEAYSSETATDAAATATDAAADAAAAAATATAAADSTAVAVAPFEAATPAASTASTGPYVANHGTSACTEDCSGHEAGYAWAEDNGITDPDDCSGNSGSFIEGCQAYAEENGEQEEE
jgi:hypothetical protein